MDLLIYFCSIVSITSAIQRIQKSPSIFMDGLFCYRRKLKLFVVMQRQWRNRLVKFL